MSRCDPGPDTSGSFDTTGVSEDLGPPRTLWHLSEDPRPAPGVFALNRLDAMESVGEVIASVVRGLCGVRPAADRIGVPHTTARGWVRRFYRNAQRLAVAFAALCVDLGSDAPTPDSDPLAFALDAMATAWRAACALPGWMSVDPWRFCSSVCGGKLFSRPTRTHPGW